MFEPKPMPAFAAKRAAAAPLRSETRAIQTIFSPSLIIKSVPAPPRTPSSTIFAIAKGILTSMITSTRISRGERIDARR